MVAVEEILWNIFTFYTLNSNPRDPSKMHNTALVKLCRDIMIFDATMTENALSLADLQLVYTSSTTSPEKTARYVTNEKSDKMDFEAFLSCLIKIAQKAYPSGLTREGCMQQLLMDNLLPCASRRKPVSIATLLKQPPIESLFKYYEEALSEIYKFYTTSSDLDRRSKNMVRSMSHLAETFDDQREVFQQVRARSSNRDPGNLPNRIGHVDFLRFANDFGLISGLGITTLDLGDIYLTVTFFNNFTPQVRKMEFKEFWEALVRCSLVAFQDKTSLTSEIKIKAMLLSIWRHIQSSVQDHMNGYGTLSGGGFNTYKGALLRGTQLLNDRFVSAWTKDDYRDYLATVVAPNSSSKPVPARGSTTNSNASGSVPPSKGAPTGPSVLSKMLKSTSSTNNNSNNNNNNNNSNTSTLSNRSRADSKSMFTTPTKKSRAPTAEIDELTEDKLIHIGHKKIAQSDNFLVKMPEGGLVRVQIASDVELNDRRVKPQDVRSLFFHKPAIAATLIEEMMELGILTDADYREAAEQADDEDAQSIDSRGDGLDIKDLINNNTPMFGRESVSEFSSPVREPSDSFAMNSLNEDDLS